MTALHDAYEKLRRERDSLPASTRDALDVVLKANCGGCKWWGEPVLRVAECRVSGDRRLTPHNYWCAAWEQREETA